MLEGVQDILARLRSSSPSQPGSLNRYKALLRLSADLGTKISESDVCLAVVNGLQDTLGYDIVALYLLDDETGDRVHAAHVGFVDPPERMKPGEGISEFCLQQGKLHYTPDASQESKYKYGVWGSEVDLPVRIGDDHIGVMIVERKETNAFSQEDFEVLTAAVQLTGIAINNARLFDQARQEIEERKRAEQQLQEYREHLQDLVDERTAELKESEQRYRSLFDGIPVGLYRTTPAGKTVDANLALVQMIGYPDRESYLSINPAEIYVDPDDRRKWQELLDKEGTLRDFEVQFRRFDGRVIWAKDTARAIIDEHGVVQFYEGTVEDITERKKAEIELRKYQEHLEELVEERTAELQESEQRYRTLFDGVPVGLYRATPEGKLLDANQAFVQMLGYSSREQLLAIDTTALHYIYPEERERWKELLDRKGVVRDFEIYGRTVDGEIGWYSDTSHLVKDENGVPLYYEGRVENITRRKQYEEEILHQKEFFEALFINTPAAVVTVDMDANVMAWNPNAEKLFGYKQAEAVGKNIEKLVADHPSIIEEARQITEQAVSSRDRVHAVTKRIHKDGSFVDVELVSVPVIVSGEQVCYMVIYHDIRGIQEARRAAEAANRAKSVFLANMSHELRTPLNAILGFSQLMERDESLTLEQKEHLGIINRSGEHLLSLINDVLEVSKIEAGRFTIHKKSFDFYHMLASLEEMFALRTEQKGLQLDIESAPEIPRFIVSDEGKLRQVLSNLLGNAIKFTKEGKVCLRTSLRSEKEDGYRLYFGVEDTGPGIPQGELVNVFEPFVQVGAADQFQEGSGLGLTISRQHVKQMGGELTVKSELGKGSVFEFEIPVEFGEDMQAAELHPVSRALKLIPGQRDEDGHPFRLLVAEDKESNRQMLVKLLETLGFDVRAVENGEQAVEVCRQWCPHLVWMDMRMPVLDGYQATRIIKSSPRGFSIIIIALTASAFEEDRERILSEGCDDFLRKPFRTNEICDMLAEHLGVEFICEDQPERLPASYGAGEDERLPGTRGEILETLPENWLADLHSATVAADLGLMLDIIGRIQDDFPEFAAELSRLAEDYEYKKITAMLEKTGRVE
ncbi:MAG: PAS domain S-box protein [Anaerolineales bacterium]